MSLTREQILERLRDMCSRWKGEETFLGESEEPFDLGMRDASCSDRAEIELLLQDADAPSPQGDTAK